MQVFEFHFNPELKPNLIFDSFCYEPENNYEKRFGSLYMVGLLKNVLPQNLRLLGKISKIIKDRCYKSTIFTPEKSLRESLKETNEFLERVSKKGDVSWLGNLSFAVLSLKDFKFNFTKVGEIKIFLLRAGKIIDVDKKLKFQDIEPYPLKIFGNIVSSKLAEDDLILVLTKEVFQFFQSKNLLSELANLDFFGEKDLKEILNKQKEELSKISGICLAVILKKEFLGKRETISPKILKEFSLKEVFRPFFKPFEKIKKRLQPSKTEKKKKLLKFPGIRLPKLKFGIYDVLPALKGRVSPKEDDISSPFHLRNKVGRCYKKVILILALISVLLVGFILSQIEEKKKVELYQNNLKEIEENINLAQSYLLLENPQAKEEANSLLKNGWDKITPISKMASHLPEYLSAQISSLKEEIQKVLYNLNELETIENPELIFEFKPDVFIPHKLLVSNENLYFFSPYSKNLFYLDKDKKENLITIDRKFNSAANLDDSILLFSKPSQLTIITDREQFFANLKEPYADFNFSDFSSFNGNLYFLDEKAGQIIKYSYRE